MQTNTTADTPTVTPAERRAAKALGDRLGDHRAAKALGLDLASFLRVLAGRPVRAGTVLLLKHGLAVTAKEAA